MKAARELKHFRTCEPYEGIEECITVARNNDCDVALEINASGFPGIVMFLSPRDSRELRYAEYEETIKGLREQEKMADKSNERKANEY